MPHPFRTPAVPQTCRVVLIHKFRIAPLPCSDSTVSFVKVLVVAGKFRSAIPSISCIHFSILLLPVLTVVSMGSCEEHVITECGFYLL